MKSVKVHHRPVTAAHSSVQEQGECDENRINTELFPAETTFDTERYSQDKLGICLGVKAKGWNLCTAQSKKNQQSLRPSCHRH